MHSIADLRKGMGRGGVRNRGKSSKAKAAEKYYSRTRSEYSSGWGNHNWRSNSGSGSWTNSSNNYGGSSRSNSGYDKGDWHKGCDKGGGKSKGKDKGKGKGKDKSNDTKALDVILNCLTI